MLNALNFTDVQIVNLFGSISQIVFIFIIGLCMIGVSKSIIKLFFRNLASKSRLSSYKKRLDTMRTLVDNIASLIVLIIFVLIILSNLGLDITPILASAGIIGLALSFGAQTLIKDYLSGIFIIMENQYNVGDIIEVGDAKGEVVRINLRTTVIKDKKGNKIFFPNSKIEKVTVFKNEPPTA